MHRKRPERTAGVLDRSVYAALPEMVQCGPHCPVQQQHIIRPNHGPT